MQKHIIVVKYGEIWGFFARRSEILLGSFCPPQAKIFLVGILKTLKKTLLGSKNSRIVFPINPYPLITPPPLLSGPEKTRRSNQKIWVDFSSRQE